MKRKWLYFMAAAVIAGMCACGKGRAEAPAGSSAEAESSAEAGRSEAGQTGSSAEDSGTEAPEDTKKKAEEEDSRTAPKKESQEYSDFQTGSWDELTFVNPWLGVSITFPEGSRIYSTEDMRSMVGESDEILVNGQEGIDIRSQASEALNIYDFMVTMPDGRSSVQLAYMNAGKAAPDREISAKDCLEEMAEELSAIEDMGYETEEIEETEVGGKIFHRFSASLMGGALYQEYYALRAGDYVAILTVSYEEQNRAAVEELIENIAAVDQ